MPYSFRICALAAIVGLLGHRQAADRLVVAAGIWLFLELLGDEVTALIKRFGRQ